MFILTAQILRQICPSLSIEKAGVISAALVKICPLYGINTADIFHELIANLCEETGEFRVTSENLNYSTAALLGTFRNRISQADAEKYGRGGGHPANQEMIANTIYGGIWGRKNLGNINPDDGYLFRGKGYIQITGRSNFTRFTDYMNKKFGTKYTVEEIAKLLETDVELSVHSACWIFAIAFQLIDEAIEDDMTTIVHRINGGSLNMALRMHYLEEATKYIKDAA